MRPAAGLNVNVSSNDVVGKVVKSEPHVDNEFIPR